MGALSVLNLAENNLGALVLPEGWTITWTEDYDSDDDEVYRHTDGRVQRDKPGKPEGLIAIANAIPDMGALSKLVMRQNDIHGAEAGKAFAYMLAQTTVLKELDLSSQGSGYHGNDLDAAFADEFAVGLVDNGGLLSLDFSANGMGASDMSSIIDVLKEHAIQHQRACTCLVGYELVTKDLRALLVATYNLNPRCWLLAIRIEQLCKDIASWL
jgi:hypothetical protein